MCSIIGYRGKNSAAPILVNGLQRMEFRGYDSVGIATKSKNQILLRKGVGKVVEGNNAVQLDKLPGNIGIGHTRWATHGKVTEKNTIAANSGKEFDINGKKIAIFNQDGYHALDGICVHQDNPIAAGKLDGDIVECPSHFWHYNIKTGELQDYLKGVKLQTYTVEERNDGIYIDL